LLLRDPPPLLPLAAGVAVASVLGSDSRVKWPNDVLVDGRKVAGILVEGRPQERWAVVGIGLNVAVRADEFPPELRESAGTMGLGPEAIEPTLERLLEALERWITASPQAVLEAFRGIDALRGRPVWWAAAHGRAAGVDGEGRLVVETDQGRVTLEAGEVHLAPTTGT
jgi:BirA family biotin operon repressor/biotin-[acetyl-CoA-carboxylase] ligase